MNRRNERKMELLALSHPLGRYARSLQPDVNAALLLVHRVLSKAMAEEPRRQLSGDLERSLRADIAHFSERRAHAGF